MPYLVLGFLLLLALFLLGRLFVNADPARLGRFIGWFVVGLGLAGAGAGLVLLIMTDRLAPAIAVAGGLAPLLWRGRAWWRRWQTASGPAGKVSEVETEILRMRLDHDTGRMSGAVRRGPFAGRRIEDLSLDELFALWRQCGAEDEPSARLLDSYIDRLKPDWRMGAGQAAPAGDVMTRDEAYAVLGLAPGADAAQIKEAHRRLMMKLHPDQGGSTYLAVKINRAKEILLGG
jgi:hypothetical protein